MKKEGLFLEKEILEEKRKKINEELLEKKRSFEVIDKKLKLLTKESRGSYNEEKETTEKIYSVLKKDISSYEEAIKELAELRDRIISKMDILTAYTDLFILYEYVMNRLEAVFENAEEPSAMDNDAVAKEILQWIFSEEEPALVNEHIKEMLSCLPVRMTKGKFLELVENAFSIYSESDSQSIDMFDYMLRSAAGLYTPKGMAKSYSKLDKVKKVFESKEFTELSKEEYEDYMYLNSLRNLTMSFNLSKDESERNKIIGELNDMAVDLCTYDNLDISSPAGVFAMLSLDGMRVVTNPLETPILHDDIRDEMFGQNGRPGGDWCFGDRHGDWYSGRGERAHF